MSYSFLKSLTLVDTGRLKTPATRNPTGMKLRIFSNGAVYPGKQLVEKFNLEYQPKDVNDEPVGNGLDIIDSQEWTPLKEYQRMIVIGVTPRTQPKVDVFSRCTYMTNGQPSATVMDQGTFHPMLLELCRSMGYLTDDQKYVDLEVVNLEDPLAIQDNIAYIPKRIERGERKGEETYQKRENVQFFVVDTPENLADMKKVEVVEEAPPHAPMLQTEPNDVNDVDAPW